MVSFTWKEFSLLFWMTSNTLLSTKCLSFFMAVFKSLKQKQKHFRIQLSGNKSNEVHRVTYYIFIYLRIKLLIHNQKHLQRWYFIDTDWVQFFFPAVCLNYWVFWFWLKFTCIFIFYNSKIEIFCNYLLFLLFNSLIIYIYIYTGTHIKCIYILY